MIDADALAKTCRQTAEGAGKALGWIAAHPERVRSEKASLEKDFRRHAVAAGKLRHAVERPMCVGVFGISQAGKSFLISALARKGTAPLMADFGRPVDFLKEINPEAKKEATGVVTRFSLRKPATPAGWPVALRLLSQTDVVKILANSYFSDVLLDDETYPTREQLSALYAELEGQAAPRPVDGLPVEDVWDLQDYVQGQFRVQRGVEALGEEYWERLADLAPRLPIRARARLFALLWNGIEAFTDLYVRLAEALRALDFAGDGYCSMDALTPKDRSVVNVDTLMTLGEPGGEALEVRSAAGAATRVSRAELTALIAELHITLSEKPWPFLEHTDLLDFPGARSRLQEPVRLRLKQSPAALAEFFLRGKVAYLFDRYSAERELTSMLLCVGPSNNEVTGIAKLVSDWIGVTHGRTPEERARQETALFVVLTKFDTAFEQTAGMGGGSDSLWTGRLNASLIQPFGRDPAGWLHNWHPGRAFDHCFWVRNPNFFAKHLIDYDGAMRETGFKAAEAARIAAYKAEYLGNPLVRTHVRDAERAWDEAMRLNDGGIAHLAAALEPVCNPQIKLRQIEGQVGALRRSMHDRLKRFHVTDDLDALLDQRKAAARSVVERLLECLEWQRFGLFLAQLHISQEEMADVYFRTGRNAKGAAADARPMLLGAGPRKDKLRSLVLDDDEDAPAPAPVPAAADHADQFAEAALAAWIARLRRVSESPDLQGFFRIPEGPFATLADELIAAANRLKLQARIAAAVRTSSAFPERFDVAAGRPVTLARLILNDHINHLGYRDLALEERPRVGKGDRARPAFAPRPEPPAEPRLGEQPEPYDEVYYTDWLRAFRDLVERNVRSRDDGSLVDVAANAELGAILKTMG